jgi:hypothetical protein
MISGKPLLTLLSVTALALSSPGVLAAEEDPGWPREITRNGATLIVYQPQLDEWTDYLRIEARVAVALTPAGGEKPLYGALWIEADTQTNMETRTVLVSNLKIVRGQFPSLDEETEQEVMRQVSELTPDVTKNISLDRLLANLQRTKALAREVPVATTPPVIYYSQQPAALLLLDGDLALAPIDGTDLLYAVNSNWDLFFQKAGSRYFLLVEQLWLAATDMKGPWTAAGKLPESFSRIPAEDSWKAVRKQVVEGAVDSFRPPPVFTSTVPAELILVDGAPEMTPIPGTTLLYAANTDADLFLDAGDGHYYYLVSGRWFRAKKTEGPWSAVESGLPEGFRNIPADHAKASVLSSVPGTVQAEEAVLQSQIPRTAAVKRSDVSVNVVYDGEPRFEPIEGTSMHYAVNTSYDVIRVDTTYYVCHQGIWFASVAPDGPWIICDVVPQVIYTIPPSSPVHHTTYVYIYDYTPDVVVVGYTAGYYGVYVWNGYVVYGTGYYYPPYYYPYGWGVVYYPRPYTYGVAAYYNPYTGTYARGGYAYGPYGGYGATARYNPATGTYARTASVWGPYGATTVGRAYNPWTGTHAATRQSGNAYSHWGQSVVSRGDEWARTGHYTDDRGTRAAFETSKGGRGAGFKGDEHSGFIARSGKDDVYVGKDGDVYKRDKDGWHKHDDGDWKKVDPPKESAARDRRSEIQQERAGEGRVDTQTGRDRRSEAQAARSERQAPASGTGSDRARSQAPRSGGDNVVSVLDRDASARQRGAQRSRDYSARRDSSRGQSRQRGRTGGFSRGGGRGRR